MTRDQFDAECRWLEATGRDYVAVVARSYVEAGITGIRNLSFPQGRKPPKRPTNKLGRRGTRAMLEARWKLVEKSK